MNRDKRTISQRRLRKYIKRTLAGACVSAGFIAAPVYADTFMVTNINDSGLGSLRQAILDANATPISGSSYHSIQSDPSLDDSILVLDSPLPVMVAPIELDVDFGNMAGNRIATPITLTGTARLSTNLQVNGVLTVNDNAHVEWYNSIIGVLSNRDRTIAIFNDHSSTDFESMSLGGDTFVNDNATLNWYYGTQWGYLTTNDNATASLENVDIVGGGLIANGTSNIVFIGAETQYQLPSDDYEYVVQANDSAQIKLENASIDTKDVQANDASLLWLSGGTSINGNAFANDRATIFLKNSTIAGNATLNNSSVLRISGDSYINGTTTLGTGAIFAPDVTNGPLIANHLELSNSKLQPWFNVNEVPNVIPVGESNNISVLEYDTVLGTFDPKVLSPLDVGITSDSYSSGAVKLYLKSNQVDLNKLDGNENAHALGGYLSDYFNSTQTPDGDLDLTNLLSNGANQQLNLATVLAITTASYDGNLNMLENTGLDVYSAHNAQTYWNQKSFIDSIKASLNNNPLYESSGTSGENPLFKGFAGNASAQLASLRQATSSVNRLNYAGNDNENSSGVWAVYNGNRQSTDADSDVGSSEWSSSTNGYTVGFTNGGDKFSWGVAAGHQDSDLNFSGGNGEQEGWNMSLYGSLKSKSTYMTGILGYGKYDNDIYDDAISSFDTKATSASLEIGKHLSEDRKGGFTPYASVLWTKIKQDDASGDDGFLLKSGSNNIFTTELGLRYNHRMFDKSDSLEGGWMAGLSWLHQGGDTGLPVNIGFSGVDGSAAIKSTPLAGNSLRVQLGAYGRIHGNLIGFAGYQGTFGSSQKINAVNAGIGYQF